MQVKKQQLELYMEELTGSKLKKKYHSDVYHHPAYLTSMQSTSGKIMNWMNLPGMKIPGRNIKNLKYVDDSTLMAESEEELRRLLMRVKESEKGGLKLNIQETKIMTSSLTTSWQVKGGNVETVSEFIFLDSKITADSDCSYRIKICLLLRRKSRQT